MSEYKRVKYAKCPLIEVTYQLNFPVILSIEANEPFGFQDVIRETYPVYNQRLEHQNAIVVNVDKANAVLNQQQVRKLHYFISEDQKCRVTLAKDMIAFSTLKYDTWDDFSYRATEIIEAFVKTYNPAYFTRLGLRYIDAIERKILGLQDSSWDELLKPHLCGCLAYKSDEKRNIRKSNVNSEIVFDDVIVNVASGLGNVDHHDGKSPSEAFILNCDYYISKRMSINDYSEMASRLHDKSHSFFRESITDRLHNAMEPIDLI